MRSADEKAHGAEHKRHRVPVEMTRRARLLRREATFPERLLWSRLRGGRAGGLKFRRQHPFGPYIADFYCAALQLVIEVDGRTHIGRAEADERRTRYLEKRGLRVLRFTNDDVIRDVDAVVATIGRLAGIERK